MTLTEEQREAIRVISKLPMAIGCQLCHPYIMKNYGSHFIVLRAMIDSSSTVEPTGGFDLERARVEVDTASARRFSESREQARIFCAEEILPDALAEIARLRAENEEALESLTAAYLLGRHEKAQEVAARPKEGKIDSSEHVTEPTKMIGFDLEKARAVDIDLLATTDWGELRARYRAALAEIERLRGEMENYGDDYVCQMKSKDARIQELEDALVEMVATNPCNIPTLCDVVHDELMCPALDGNCDFWKGCPQKNELREAARKQLQAEGKIGNGDHIAETDQMVPNGKVWQITEERKAAIDRGLQFLEWSYAKNSAHDTKEQIAVLWAMLDEVGQEIKNIKTVEI